MRGRSGKRDRYDLRTRSENRAWVADKLFFEVDIEVARWIILVGQVMIYELLVLLFDEIGNDKGTEIVRCRWKR